MIHLDLLRYAVAGGLAAASDLAAYAALTKLAGAHPLAANLVSRPIGGLVGFTLNRIWTFRHRARGGKTHRQFARFWVVWTIAYALSELLVGVFHRALPTGAVSTKILAECCVSPLTFFLQRHWTFRGTPWPPDKAEDRLKTVRQAHW